MPHAFKILQADHTGITVRNLDLALAFWRDTLGFKLMYRARRTGAFAADVTGVSGADIEIAVLLAPGHKIELLQYHAPADTTVVRSRACDVGSVHIAFDVNDLDAAVAGIEAAGWASAGSPQSIEGGARHGTRVVYIRDPDGTTIELMQPPSV